MTKMKLKTKTDQKPGKNIELVPDAWEQFERAVDAAVKSGPKHRTAKGEKRKPKKKVQKGENRSG